MMLAARTTHSRDETLAFAVAIGEQLRPGDVVVLTGDLGAGKTVFAQGIARALGVDEPVTSPTFTIVQEYAGRYPLAHVDVYRIDRIQELHDFGFDELFDGRIVVIEWGEAVARVLPRDRLAVHIEIGDDDLDERRIEVVGHGPDWATRFR